jgi:hypothetical protein
LTALGGETAALRRRCERCGHELDRHAVCAICFIRSTLRNPPTRIGPYEIVREIGRGGMGIVYLARRANFPDPFALKVIRQRELARGVDRALFVREAKCLLLSHENIVPLLDPGEHEGQPYYAMKFVPGGALRERMDEFREPRRAADLMARVARAVHHLHRHLVLHGDLKPSNVLIDATSQPLVSDFGIARIIGEPPSFDAEALGVMGAVAYVAPEQAAGQPPTTACDIYAIGVMLYEVLSGRRPIEGDSTSVILEQLPVQVPRPLRELAPKVSRDLERICQQCLEKNPEKRYRTAIALADDLAQVVLGAPPIYLSNLPRGARVWRLLRRHPLPAALVTALALLCAGLIGTVQIQATQMRDEARRLHGSIATRLAGAVLYQLREYGDVLLRAAQEPVVRKLALGDPVQEAPELATFVQGTISSIGVSSAAGIRNARWPTSTNKEAIGAPYGWRGYIAGARELGRIGRSESYVGPAILSTADGEHKLVVAAPIFDAGRWIGVIYATIAADTGLGALQMVDPLDAQRAGVLLAPEDRNAADQDLPGAYLIVFHGRVVRGRAERLPLDLTRAIEASLGRPAAPKDQFHLPDPRVRFIDDQYRDPLDPAGRRMIAGFAPVGGTGLVVGVQTPYDAITRPFQLLLIWIFGFLVLVVGLLAGTALRARRRPRVTP